MFKIHKNHKIFTFLFLSIIISFCLKNQVFADNNFVNNLKNKQLALSNSQEYYKNANHIFFNDESGGCVNFKNDSNFSINVSGNTFQEKIFSGLTSAGFTKEQTAGIMGNIMAESQFLPTRQQDCSNKNTCWPNGGWGLFQWDKHYDGTTGKLVGRRIVFEETFKKEHPKLYNKFYKPELGTLDKYQELEKDPDIDALIKFQLDYMINEIKTRPVTNIQGYDGKTEYEAIKSATTLEEASKIWVMSFEIPQGYNQKWQWDKRAGYGQEIFNGDYTSSVSNVVCNEQGIIGPGGLNETQAKKFTMRYGQDQNQETTKIVEAWPTGCAGGRLSNCVAFTQFFLKKFTKAPAVNGNGEDIVKNLEAQGVPTGTEPRPLSVFSFSYKSEPYGHTGIIMGINQQGQYIVAQAGCSTNAAGKGNGLYGSGAAGIVVSDNIGTATLGGNNTLKYAYLQNVDINLLNQYVGGQ